MTWVTVGALALLCVFMRTVVPLALDDRRPVWLERSLERALPALLAAIVVVGIFADGQRLVLDARVAGLAAAVVAVALRAHLLVVVAAAATVTAVLRAVT